MAVIAGYVSEPVFGRKAQTVATPARLRTKARKIGAVVDAPGSGPVEVVHGDQRAVVPAELVSMLLTAVRAIEDGDGLTLVVGAPDKDAEISSQTAADLLNVSRPHVVKLAREGALRHRMVGNRHRFQLQDVLLYDRRMRLERDAALTALSPDEGYLDGDF